MLSLISMELTSKKAYWSLSRNPVVALPVVVGLINPVDPLVEIGGGAGPRFAGGGPERENCWELISTYGTQRITNNSYIYITEALVTEESQQIQLGYICLHRVASDKWYASSPSG